MKNRLLLTAAMAAALAPTMGGASIAIRRGESPAEPSLGDWFTKNRKRLTKRQRSVSALQRSGWHETPCDAPAGYFWHRAPQGRQLYYLLKCAPSERRVVYDPVHDRSIIYSGWGYVKPTYAPGDVR